MLVLIGFHDTADVMRIFSTRLIVCINGLCDFSQSLFFMLRFNRVVNIDKNPLKWKY